MESICSTALLFNNTEKYWKKREKTNNRKMDNNHMCAAGRRARAVDSTKNCPLHHIRRISTKT